MGLGSAVDGAPVVDDQHVSDAPGHQGGSATLDRIYENASRSVRDLVDGGHAYRVESVEWALPGAYTAEETARTTLDDEHPGRDRNEASRIQNRNRHNYCSAAAPSGAKGTQQQKVRWCEMVREVGMEWKTSATKHRAKRWDSGGSCLARNLGSRRAVVLA